MLLLLSTTIIVDQNCMSLKSLKYDEIVYKKPSNIPLNILLKFMKQLIYNEKKNKCLQVSS